MVSWKMHFLLELCDLCFYYSRDEIYITPFSAFMIYSACFEEKNQNLSLIQFLLLPYGIAIYKYTDRYTLGWEPFWNFNFYFYPRV